jgi:hypothetical protein
LKVINKQKKATTSSTTELSRRKRISRQYLRSLSAKEKIEKLAQLQGQYFQFLSIRAANGGKPIPDEWQKWYRARLQYSRTIES